MSRAPGPRRRRIGAVVAGASVLAFSLLAEATRARFTVAKVTNSARRAR